MVKVEFFGNYRLEFGIAEMDIEAGTIKDMFTLLSGKFPAMNSKEIFAATLFINDKIEQGIFRNHRKLKDGDKILMMYPSCGG